MTPRVNASTSHSLLWNLAEDLSHTKAPLRRAAGPHRGWFNAAAAMTAAALLILVVAILSPPELGDFWRFALVFIGVPALMTGLYVALWAGTDTSVRYFNVSMRASATGRRVLARLGSLFGSAVIAVCFTVAVHNNSSTPTLVGLVTLQLVAVWLSVSALSASPPLIGVLTRVHPGRARVWSLVAWLVACVVAGSGVAVVASRLQGQVATISVVIGIMAVFVATYTQQRHAFDLRLERLQKSLSTLHRHLKTEGTDAEVIEAATDLEAALTLYPPAPFSLPIQLPIDNELRASLFYAITRVTGLPYREVLAVDAAVLGKRLAGRDLRDELAEFVWELRRRALRSDAIVRQQNTSRYDPLSFTAAEILEPATENAALG